MVLQQPFEQADDLDHNRECIRVSFFILKCSLFVFDMFDLYQKLLSQLGLIWLIVLAVWHIWQCIWSIGGAVVDYCESGQVRRDSNRDNGRSQISRNTNKTSKQWQKVQALSWCVSVQKKMFFLPSYRFSVLLSFLSWCRKYQAKRLLSLSIQLVHH